MLEASHPFCYYMKACEFKIKLATTPEGYLTEDLRKNVDLNFLKEFYHHLYNCAFLF